MWNWTSNLNTYTLGWQTQVKPWTFDQCRNKGVCSEKKCIKPSWLCVSTYFSNSAEKEHLVTTTVYRPTLECALQPRSHFKRFALEGVDDCDGSMSQKTSWNTSKVHVSCPGVLENQCIGQAKRHRASPGNAFQPWNDFHTLDNYSSDLWSVTWRKQCALELWDQVSHHLKSPFQHLCGPGLMTLSRQLYTCLNASPAIKALYVDVQYLLEGTGLHPSSREMCPCQMSHFKSATWLERDSLKRCLCSVLFMT